MHQQGTLTISLALAALCATACQEDPKQSDTGETGLAPMPEFTIEAGSTQKICQITGEYDYHEAAEAGVDPHDMPAHNQTYSRYGIHGTDLGAAFEHKGQLWMLFGDTFSTETIPGDPDGHSEPNVIAADATAFTSDQDPEDCIDLQFLTREDKPEVWLGPSFDPGGAIVQSEGLSVGDSYYVWYTTEENASGALARSDDDGRSFTELHDVSDNRFMWVSAELMEDHSIVGLEDLGSTDWVYVFGTGPTYRQSDLFLAVVPVDSLEDPSGMAFFSGLNSEGLPVWSDSEADAQPVIDVDNPLPSGDWFLGIPLEEKEGAEGCIGEFSVHWNDTLDSWVAMYNCDFLSIELHTAAYAWGPWSEAVTVFDPIEDGGFCSFLHLHEEWDAILQLGCDYNVTIEGRVDQGSPYGPYVMERYTTGNADEATLYFPMSMWHPYNVNLMKTTVRRK